MEQVPTSSRHLLLTGMPGVGKTTVIRRLAEGLAGKQLGGFYTEEIRKAGVRQGFRLLSFDGQEWLIAHVDLAKRYRVSKYGVDVAAIDAAVYFKCRAKSLPTLPGKGSIPYLHLHADHIE